MSRLADEWTEGRVLRLNTVSEINKRYADKIGVTTTPTFILYDNAGKELRRWIEAAPSVVDLVMAGIVKEAAAQLQVAPHASGSIDVAREHVDQVAIQDPYVRRRRMFLLSGSLN